MAKRMAETTDIIRRLEDSALSESERWAYGDWRVDKTAHRLINTTDDSIYLDLQRFVNLYLNYDPKLTHRDPVSWVMRSLELADQYPEVVPQNKWIYGSWFLNYDDFTLELLGDMKNALHTTIVVDDMIETITHFLWSNTYLFVQGRKDGEHYLSVTSLPNGPDDYSGCSVAILRETKEACYEVIAEKECGDRDSAIGFTRFYFPQPES